MSGRASGEGAYARLLDAFLAGLRLEQRERLLRLVRSGAVPGEADLRALPGLAALCDGEGLGGLCPVFCAQITKRLGAGVGDATGVPDEIAALCEQGRFDEALACLERAGGAFFATTHGLARSRAVALAFPEALRERQPVLALLDGVNALKQGNIPQADLILARLGRGRKIPALDTCGKHPDSALVCFLFMKAVYEDAPVSDTALSSLFECLSGLPREATLLRGLLYNVGLDVFLRQNRLPLAEEAALRALHHYRNAGASGLSFYVLLYLAVIALERGEIAAAGEHLAEAGADLARFGDGSPNDALLLKALCLSQRYEAGEVGPLVDHLMGDGETIPTGELWPAMAAPILAYGRRALVAGVTPSAALAWVRRWRVRQWRSQRFDTLISVQEALALQAAGRWQESDEILAQGQGEPGAARRLALLAGALERAPASEELGRQLGDLAARHDMSLRQRANALLLAAQSASERGAEHTALRFLGQAFAAAGPDVLPRLFSEKQRCIEAIMRRRGVRDLARRQPGLWRALSDVMQPGAGAGERPGGLTRQEHRVLLLLAEGLSNKAIALRLGVALPTVKFHVSNLLRKAGCGKRREVVAYGLASGWLEP